MADTSQQATPNSLTFRRLWPTLFMTVTLPSHEQANMGAVRGDCQFDPEFRRLPDAGELFLWPAFLHHLLHPNLLDVPRLSFSFNVVLRYKANYL
tara:strand:- start:466 stop:750 length:285 start_codon:yes stop_codon:yes gene_type:complete